MLFENRFNILSLTDWHVPYHDPKALQSAFAFAAQIQPDVLIIHECHDFYSLSRFDKDPKRIDSLQEELDAVSLLLGQLRSLCPASRIIMLQSNHSNRLRKYLRTQAQALHSLRALDLPTLMQLEAHGVEFAVDFMHKGVLFKHGDIIRKHSGMTARAEFMREGVSGASGHTHRLASHYRRLRGGEFVWLESGCLCNLNPDWIDGTADWQHGISLVSFKSPTRKTFFATVIPIVDYEIPL